MFMHVFIHAFIHASQVLRKLREVFRVQSYGRRRYVCRRLKMRGGEGWEGGRKRKNGRKGERERERERTREEGGVERRRGSGRERERARNHIEKEEEVRGGNSPLYLCGCRLVSHTPPCLAPPCLSAGGNVTSRTTRPYSSLEWKACY